MFMSHIYLVKLQKQKKKGNNNHESEKGKKSSEMGRSKRVALLAFGLDSRIVGIHHILL